VEVSLSFDAPAVKRGSLRVVHFPEAGRTRTGARMNGADGTVSPAALTSSDDGNPDGDGPAYEELSHALTEENGRSTVTFSTDSFSVYGIVYTVDLFWFDEENGRRTEYSLPGGGGISLGELLSRLGVARDDPETAENELSAFLDTVEAVTFSDPALVWTGYADSDTTVGELKASRGLACDYSAELTEEERAELDGYAVSAGDWALIALKAFSTEEKLTVVRTDGEVLELLVTDAQGDSPYRIEYTWSEWWTSTAKVNVCYYDDKNNDITSQIPGGYTRTAGDNEYVYLESEFEKEIEGYTFDHFEYNGQIIDTLFMENYQGTRYVNFLKDGQALSYTDVRDGDFLEVRAIYKSKPAVTTSSIHLTYVDENGTAIADPVDIPVEATASGNVVRLDQAPCQKDIPGYTYLQKRCGNENAFDSVQAILRQDTSEPVWNLLNGENVKASFAFGADPLSITYQYKKNSGEEPEVKPSLSDPTASKTLTPNLKDPDDPTSGDGTYTLTLSMEVPMVTSSGGSRANVVVIYDSSNSMHLPAPGNEWTRDDEHGTYAEYNGKYYQLNSFGTDVRKVFSFIDDEGVTHSFGTDQKNNGIFCRPKYTPSRTRMDVAEEQVKEELAKNLFSNNTASDPARVEVAFVEFASDIQQVQQPTTDRSVFEGWVNDCHTAIEETQNAGDLRGGTNWDAALRIAGGRPYEGHDTAIQFSDNDPKYIIFVSDGNPTARTTPDGLISGNPDDSSAEYDDGTRIGSSGLFGGVTPGVYGTGISDDKSYNYDRAKDQAALIVGDPNTTLYTVGIFGDADKMAGLNPKAKYYDGSNPQSMKNAFDDIAKNISSSLGYTNLSMLDGITSMTSTTLSGNPDDFTYKVTKKVNNEDGTETVVDVTDEVLGSDFNKAVYHAGSDPDHPYEGGHITWDLGSNDLLLPGGTYSLSFIVWPEQEAYDLVSALNNGMKTWADLTDEEKSQVVGSGDGTAAPFSLRTNTRQQVTYSTAEVEEKEGEDPVVKPGPVQTAELDTPEPMPLTDTEIEVEKKWNISLSPKELDEFLENYRRDHGEDYKLELALKAKAKQSGEADSVYISPIVIRPETNPEAGPDDSQYKTVWHELDVNGDPAKHHIPTGLMVSAKSGIDSGLFKDENGDGIPDDKKGYEEVTFTAADGTVTKYYILEKGQDFYFEEVSGGDYHFEFEEKVFHPMVVDGVKMDVTFDGNTVKALDPLTALTAVNDLKGGINLNKVIVDENGYEVTPPDGQTFTVTGSVTKDGEGTALEYRIYGPDRDDGSVPGQISGRSEKFPIADSSSFTLELKPGEMIRIGNVPSGYTYTFRENTDALDGTPYTFYSVAGVVTEGEGIPVDDERSGLRIEGDTLSAVTLPNAAQTVTFANETSVSAPEPELTLEHHKQIDWLGDGEANPDTEAYDGADPSVKNDLYRLYLDVKLSHSVTNANIILVEDYSTSMDKNYMDGVSRYDVMRNALAEEGGFIDSALAEGSGNRLSASASPTTGTTTSSPPGP